MSKLKLLFNLFFTMARIGLFTFGGGYAMIGLLERELVQKKNWISYEDFTDLIVIAESTPGPVAVNFATYIGYKRCGVLGAIISTIGMCLPSFAVIYFISLFFDKFLSIEIIAAAFRGVQVCVIFLIFSAGFKMLKKMKKTLYNLIIFFLTVVISVIFSIFAVNFSSVFYIFISAFLGLFLYIIGIIKGEKGDKEK